MLIVNTEHLLKIRHFLRRKKECDIIADGKFFDSVSFWQKAYEDSQAEQTKLLNTIYELEQRNQSLFAKVRREVLQTESQNTLSTKRKAASTSNHVDRSETTKKRPRRPAQKEAEVKDNEVERECHCT
jgi:hypothetical protein